MGAEGRELSTNSAGKSLVSDSGSAKSGAPKPEIDAELARVNAAWPELSEADRRAILAIIQKGSEQR
jgi:hypothetical protein